MTPVMEPLASIATPTHPAQGELLAQILRAAGVDARCPGSGNVFDARLIGRRSYDVVVPRRQLDTARNVLANARDGDPLPARDYARFCVTQAARAAAMTQILIEDGVDACWGEIDATGERGEVLIATPDRARAEACFQRRHQEAMSKAKFSVGRVLSSVGSVGAGVALVGALWSPQMMGLLAVFLPIALWGAFMLAVQSRENGALATFDEL
jgi:hypothetical protein